MTHHHSHGCGCGSHDKPLSHKGAALAHWTKLRLSSLILVPLTLWLVISIIGLVGADHAMFTAWLRAPLNAGLLGSFILLGCYHGALGVQEIIEDYISNEKAAHCAITAEKLGFAVVAALCIVSIVMIVL